MWGSLSPCAGEKEELYSTRHGEAVKIFNSLLNQDSLADPIKQVQEILQKCFDMQDLQSEVRRGREEGEGEKILC